MTAEQRGGSGRAQANVPPRGRQEPNPAVCAAEPITTAALPEQWRLWFPQRLGPWRTVYKTVAGIRMKGKARKMEFPPGPNGSRGNPYGHAAWVKEWRDEAKRVAQEAGIPPQQRVRVSLVIHRRALGTADEDNDRSRAKGLLDGLRDAGVIKKDTRQFVEHGTCTEVRAEPGRAGIELIVEPLEPL